MTGLSVWVFLAPRSTPHTEMLPKSDWNSHHDVNDFCKSHSVLICKTIDHLLRFNQKI